MRPTTRCRLENQRDEMRFGLVPFADTRVHIGARGVEVAQSHGFQSVCAIVVFEYLLDHPLGPAIRIDRVTRMRFVDRHIVRLAIDGGSRREDETLHAVPQYRVEQCE